MKYLGKLIFFLLLTITAACSAGFDIKKANELLDKKDLTPEDYSEMIQLYEIGVDDALKFSQQHDKQLTSDRKEEMQTIYAIRTRLSKDDTKLTEEQRKEFERINQKGTEAAE